MRLIDADELKKKFGYTDEWYKSRTVAHEIDNAPTVEERPHGKWLIDGHSTLYHVCSNCGGAGDHYDYFCRICGADMKGGAE